MKTHPTAIVEDGAIVGEDVEIGPYALVGPHVLIGPGCVIRGHAVLTGHLTLGPKNFVGHGAILGEAPQDFAYDPARPAYARIGEGNTFREYVTVHCGTGADSETVVGDGNFLMAGSHLGHNCHVGNRTIIANNCLLGGHVEVGDNAVLGGGTVFHQFMRIGRLAMVRGGTRFGKDIPPFSMGDEDNILAGLNAVGLRRNGISSAARLELKRAFKLAFRSGLNVGQALAAAKTESWGPEATEFFDFIASSKRGVCPAHQSKVAGDDGGED